MERNYNLFGRSKRNLQTAAHEKDRARRVQRQLERLNTPSRHQDVPDENVRAPCMQSLPQLRQHEVPLQYDRFVRALNAHELALVGRLLAQHPNGAAC